MKDLTRIQAKYPELKAALTDLIARSEKAAGSHSEVRVVIDDLKDLAGQLATIIEALDPEVKPPAPEVKPEPKPAEPEPE